ncbi:MAG: hypothetical protein M1392_06745 [Gammaproteobacteria bacterium]|nr:hypothetical protein [Gammaproteobacteria bacterium]
MELLLTRTALPETSYGADMELFEKSRTLSFELIRLPLAGIAVVGFLITRITNLSMQNPFSDGRLQMLISGSVIAFALTVLFALLERFYASGAMFHHVKAMKLLQYETASLVEVAKAALRTRGVNFMLAHRFMQIAAALLVLATCLLGAAFIRLLTWM